MVAVSRSSFGVVYNHRGRSPTANISIRVCLNCVITSQRMLMDTTGLVVLLLWKCAADDDDVTACGRFAICRVCNINTIITLKYPLDQYVGRLRQFVLCSVSTVSLAP